MCKTIKGCPCSSQGPGPPVLGLPHLKGSSWHCTVSVRQPQTMATGPASAYASCGMHATVALYHLSALLSLTFLLMRRQTQFNTEKTRTLAALLLYCCFTVNLVTGSPSPVILWHPKQNMQLRHADHSKLVNKGYWHLVGRGVGGSLRGQGVHGALDPTTESGPGHAGDTMLALSPV